MKIADERTIHAVLLQLGDNVRNGSGCFAGVYGDAHDLRARLVQLSHLLCSSWIIFSRRVCHRLNKNGMLAADVLIADFNCGRFASLDGHSRALRAGETPDYRREFAV